jgi:hypothetical protein
VALAIGPEFGHSLVPEICHVPVCRLCSSSNGDNRLHLSVVAEATPGPGCPYLPDQGPMANTLVDAPP